jgi:hypothetical protein
MSSAGANVLRANADAIVAVGFAWTDKPSSRIEIRWWRVHGNPNHHRSGLAPDVRWSLLPAHLVSRGNDGLFTLAGGPPATARPTPNKALNQAYGP